MSKNIRKANKVSANNKGATLAFFLNAIARPSQGKNVKAYTHAWMVLSGVAAGGTMPKKDMQRIAGNTMVSYHLSPQRRTLETRDNGEVGLSAIGKEFFGNRATNDDETIALQHVYMAILAGGQPDGSIVKNPSAIEAL